jgi:hypothetical protein
MLTSGRHHNVIDQSVIRGNIKHVSVSLLGLLAKIGLAITSVPVVVGNPYS